MFCLISRSKTTKLRTTTPPDAPRIRQVGVLAGRGLVQKLYLFLHLVSEVATDGNGKVFQIQVDGIKRAGEAGRGVTSRQESCVHPENDSNLIDMTSQQCRLPTPTHTAVLSVGSSFRRQLPPETRAVTTATATATAVVSLTHRIARGWVRSNQAHRISRQACIIHIRTQPSK